MSILGPILGVVGIGGIGAALVFIPGAAAIAGKAVSGALAFLSTLPWYVFVMAALTAFALFEWHGRSADNDRYEKTITGKNATIAADVQAMKTMTASLTGALSRINDNNRRIAAAATELEREKQEAAAADARSNARYVPTGAAVGRLEASAATKGLPPCKVSQEAAHALEGL